MSNSSSRPTVTGCSFTDNLADVYGGGMYNSNSSRPTVSNCTFSGNSASRGGGMYNTEYSSSTVTGCTFTDNWASYGGGMSNVSSSPTVTGCTFTGNLAYSSGGMLNSANSVPIVSNCTFTDNWAYTAGGGMRNSQSNPTVINCTFSGNSADDYGGGMSNSYYSSPAVSNCILWGNSASNSHEIYNDVSYPSTPVISYCDIAGCLPGGSWDSSLGTDGGGNIDTDPYFADPGYWEPDPCDPCELQWVEGDYHLKSEAGRWDPIAQDWVYDDVTSRCIDAGNPGMPIGDEYPDPCNVRVNMGTYGGTAEASRSPVGWAILTDATNDGIVDDADLLLQSQHWLETGENLSCDFNRDGVVDLVDFAMLTDEWLKMTPWYGL